MSAECGRGRDELKAISGSHVSLTNLIIVSNTKKQSDVLAKLKAAGPGVTDDIVRRLGPVFFCGIDFRGTLSFSIEKYAAIHLSGAEVRMPALLLGGAMAAHLGQRLAALPSVEQHQNSHR